MLQPIIHYSYSRLCIDDDDEDDESTQRHNERPRAPPQVRLLPYQSTQRCDQYIHAQAEPIKVEMNWNIAEYLPEQCHALFTATISSWIGKMAEVNLLARRPPGPTQSQPVAKARTHTEVATA